MFSTSWDKKLFALIAILGASVIATTWISGLGSFLNFFPPAWKPSISHQDMDETHSSHLAETALYKLLKDASPIFGHYSDVQSETSTWMSNYPDDTKIVHMNIPGAHDAATWNYSAATQQSLKPVTDLLDDTSHPPEWFRCQDMSIVNMLNAGVRAFDLRYAQDITKSTLVFWHERALQSQTATVEAVLFGFYKWLDDHPSEALFLSFQYEGNLAMGNIDNAEVQLQLYNVLTSPAAQKYVLQTRDTFGTLGSMRGKMILLRRFDLNLLPPSYESSIPGIHFSPQEWTVNSPSIALTYNPNPTSHTEEGIAYIEDYYRPLTPPTAKLSEDIDVKFSAARSHLDRAASREHPDGLFWTFTSGTNVREQEGAADVTPRMMALGDEEEAEETGVNQRLVELLRDRKGSRLGIVMFDFFEVPGELMKVFLGLREV